MDTNTDQVRALIGQWRDAAEFFKGDAGSDIRETLMACASELESALAQQPARVGDAAAIRAFEEHFQASSDDPYFEGELELWLTAWRKALGAQQRG